MATDSSWEQAAEAADDGMDAVHFENCLFVAPVHKCPPSCAPAGLLLLTNVSCGAADIISAVEFDQTGQHLATGDRGGRVVLFERLSAPQVGPRLLHQAAAPMRASTAFHKQQTVSNRCPQGCALPSCQGYTAADRAGCMSSS